MLGHAAKSHSDRLVNVGRTLDVERVLVQLVGSSVYQVCKLRAPAIPTRRPFQDPVPRWEEWLAGRWVGSMSIIAAVAPRERGGMWRGKGVHRRGEGQGKTLTKLRTLGYRNPLAG